MELVLPRGSTKSLRSERAPATRVSSVSALSGSSSDSVEKLTDSEELVNQDSGVSTASFGSKKTELTVR